MLEGAPESSWGVGKAVNEELYAQLRKISEESAKRKAKAGIDDQKVGSFWATAIEENKVEAVDLSPLKPDPRPIKKCVCFDTTFAQLKEAEIKSVEEASERFGCGTNCGLCRPYIQKMVETGETEFPV